MPPRSEVYPRPSPPPRLADCPEVRPILLDSLSEFSFLKRPRSKSSVDCAGLPGSDFLVYNAPPPASPAAAASLWASWSISLKGIGFSWNERPLLPKRFTACSSQGASSPPRGNSLPIGKNTTRQIIRGENVHPRGSCRPGFLALRNSRGETPCFRRNQAEKCGWDEKPRSPAISFATRGDSCSAVRACLCRRRSK